MNLDSSVLSELKRRAHAEGKSLGDVISEIVAPALAAGGHVPGPPLRWNTASMGPALVDIEDKDAVRRALGDA